MCADLTIKIGKTYPTISPVIKITNTRGLSDDYISKLYTITKEKCQSMIGQPVVYEVIEVSLYS